MYWKAAIIKYKGENRIRVGILLFYTLSPEEKPVMFIWGILNESGVKRKWRKPMKIKRWLLYDYHSHSYATKSLNRTIFKDEFKLTEIGKRNKLWLFDKEIIKKKFPNISKEIFKEMNKKKK